MKNQIIKSFASNYLRTVLVRSMFFRKVWSPKFYNGQEITLLGKSFKIEVFENHRAKNTASAKFDNISSVKISVPHMINSRRRNKIINNLARRCISKALIPEIRNHVASINNTHFNFDYNNVAIKAQLSRWGSCSISKKNINLNFKLLFFPKEIMDSVIVHELAHLKEPNHSKRFYALVESAIPDYKQRKRWLNKNGNKPPEESIYSNSKSDFKNINGKTFIKSEL